MTPDNDDRLGALVTREYAIACIRQCLLAGFSPVGLYPAWVRGLMTARLDQSRYEVVQ